MEGNLWRKNCSERIRSIGANKLTIGDKIFLTDEEVSNLNIPKGTLTPEEREIINDHILNYY